VRLLTSGGITSWTREITTADVSEGSEEVRALAFDSSGDVYAAGIVADAFVGFTDLGGHDIFVMKLNGATGVPIWTQQFGSAGEDLVGAIRLSADGSALYIAGSVDGALPGQTNAGDRDAYVRAMSTSTGAVSWTHQFGTTSTDEGRGLTLGPSGDVFVTGWTNNPLVAGMWFGGGDGFIRRLNSSGSPQWTYQFGTSSRDEAYAIIYAGDGYLCVAGMTQGEFPGQVAGGGLDAFVARVLPE